MSVNKPTLPELIESGAARFEAALPGVLVRLQHSLVGVLNRVFSAGLYALYGYAEYLDRQKWPDTCDVEFLPEHGARWGKPRKAATYAVGAIILSGTDGAMVPLGTQLQRADGMLYQTMAAVTLSNGAAVGVQALEAGVRGNYPAPGVLSFISTPAGVDSQAVLSDDLTGGIDLEEAQDWRARILLRIRKPPQGGSAADYVDWALELPGVTRVWVAAEEMGAGTVSIRFVRDNDTNIFPDAIAIGQLQAYLNERKPVTAKVIVLAPNPLTVNLSIALTPNTPDVRTAVLAELQDLFRRESQPGSTLLISRIREAISVAAGESDHTLINPITNVIGALGQMAILGTVTFL